MTNSLKLETFGVLGDKNSDIYKEAVDMINTAGPQTIPNKPISGGMSARDARENGEALGRMLAEDLGKSLGAEITEIRGKTHGDFGDHARITQNIKRAMQDSPNWDKLTDAQKEALEMEAHKNGRILAGDPNFADHWVDKVGYNHLVIERLTSKPDAGK